MNLPISGFAAMLIAAAFALSPGAVRPCEGSDAGVPRLEDLGISLDVECRSGSPLVLEFVLGDGNGRVRSAGFDFESDGREDLRVDAAGAARAGRVRRGGADAGSLDRTGCDAGGADGGAGTRRELILFRGVPYRERGTYRATVDLETDVGAVSRSFLISFIDFVWGRDNFRFANDGPFENSFDFVSKTVIDWAEDRFGELARERELLALTVMYGFFRGSIGRCYGFTGLQVFELERPGPASVYEIDEHDADVLRRMDWLQNDIVFANFVSGKRPLEGPASERELRAELASIRGSVLEGRPVVLGCVGKDLHHSMVVYGFFEDLGGSKTTLLLANNWIRDQDDNVYSEDAENVVVDFQNVDSPVTFFDITRRKYRNIERFFVVPLEESYEHDRGEFDALLEDAERRLVEGGRTVLMVENTEEAFLVDGNGKRTGYRRGQTVLGIEGVRFKKVDFNYVFEVPVDKPSLLVLDRRIFNKEKGEYKGVNLYALVPNAGADRSRSPTPLGRSGGPGDDATAGFSTYVFEGLPVPHLSPLFVSVGRNGVSVAPKRGG